MTSQPSHTLVIHVCKHNHIYIINILCDNLDHAHALQREQPPNLSYAHGDRLIHAAAVPPVTPISARRQFSKSQTTYILMIGKVPVRCNEKKMASWFKFTWFVQLKRYFNCDVHNFIKDEQLEYITQVFSPCWDHVAAGEHEGLFVCCKDR